MARMQLVPLPPVRMGEYEQIPFIVIIDQVGHHDGPPAVPVDLIQHATGAALVIVEAGALDAPALELSEDQKAALIDRLGLPAAL